MFFFSFLFGPWQMAWRVRRVGSNHSECTVIGVSGGARMAIFIGGKLPVASTAYVSLILTFFDKSDCNKKKKTPRSFAFSQAIWKSDSTRALCKISKDCHHFEKKKPCGSSAFLAFIMRNGEQMLKVCKPPLHVLLTVQATKKQNYFSAYVFWRCPFVLSANFRAKTQPWNAEKP